MKYDPNKTLKECLSQFYKSQGIDPKNNDKFINYINFFFFKFPFPNFKSRQEIVYLHDIDHILLDADTSFTDEGRVAAFELSSRFRKKALIGYIYAPIALITGFIAAPIQTLKAFKKYKGTKNATHLKGSKESILNLKVIEARKLLNIS